MAQPPIPDMKIPPDTKVPSPPAMSPGPVPASLPPSYPSTFPPYPQPQGPGIQQPFAGQPLQPPYGGLPPQQLPPGARPPLGTLSPQYTGHASPQVPLATIPPQQVPMGLPQQSLGNSPPQQIPMMNLQMMQAQLGTQFQATQYAQCAIGNHMRQTKYGVLGIIGAIVFFPIGLLCLFADQHDVCLRCGQRL